MRLYIAIGFSGSGRRQAALLYGGGDKSAAQGAVDAAGKKYTRYELGLFQYARQLRPREGGEQSPTAPDEVVDQLVDDKLKELAASALALKACNEELKQELAKLQLQLTSERANRPAAGSKKQKISQPAAAPEDVAGDQASPATSEGDDAKDDGPSLLG